VQQEAVWLVKGKDMPWEVNRHGKMQWYLHPAIGGVALKTMLFYKQEIPPGSSSGRQQCQGGMIFYILEGRGYTILNGQRHQWSAGDIVNLPLLEEGCTYQHFNADADQPVVMLGCYANHLDAIGVDAGSGFDELEPAPEYRQQHGSQP
jgi:gentisate 1,2-dioxygenase